MNGRRLRISFNAPVILSFALICVAAQALNLLTHGASNRLLFSTYRSSLLNPLTYVVNAERALFNGVWDTSVVAWGALSAVVTAVLGLWVGIVTMRRAH